MKLWERLDAAHRELTTVQVSYRGFPLTVKTKEEKEKAEALLRLVKRHLGGAEKSLSLAADAAAELRKICENTEAVEEAK
jgi:hypothetical protein